MFIRKILSGLTSGFLTVLFLLFVLSNPDPVTLGLWPFATTLQAPLYLFFLLTLFGGFFVGLALMWLWQHKHRADARRLRKELEQLKESKSTSVAVIDPSLTPPVIY